MAHGPPPILPCVTMWPWSPSVWCERTLSRRGPLDPGGPRALQLTEAHLPQERAQTACKQGQTAEGPGVKRPAAAGSWKGKSPRKIPTSALSTTPRPLTVWITTNCGKFWKRWEYQTTWPASWEICMQVMKQQLELGMEQQTGSKLGKEYVKAVYCHPAYLTYMQSTSSEKAMAPHSSTLAWKIPWTEEPGRLQSMGSLRVGHNWATSLSLSCIGEGNGNPLQCSCLENPRDGGAWWAAIYGVAQSQTRLKGLRSSSRVHHKKCWAGRSTAGIKVAGRNINYFR